MNARMIQTNPIPARIANVVNRSFVDWRSSIDERAVEILADAQFINPADSSSCVGGVVKNENMDDDDDVVAVDGATKSAGGV